jgi:hypothetical protein
MQADYAYIEYVDKEKVKVQAKRVSDARTRLMAEERRLTLAVWRFLQPRGSMRNTAKELGITPQYLCDIAHGRRKVSEAIVGKLMEL